MSGARYLIAKYIPDLSRMEPRNIGVIVWTAEQVIARFSAERLDLPRQIDGRSIPSFVQSKQAYRQWVTYWYQALAQQNLRPVKGGESVTRSDPGFLEALKSTGRGKYVLVDGGVTLDEVPTQDMGNLLGQLFASLVESSDESTDELRERRLQGECEALLQESNLRGNPHFHEKFPVECRVDADTSESFVFNYAVQNGSLQRLYQRVPLARRDKTEFRRAIHSESWIFEKVLQNGVVDDRDNAVAIVDVTPEQEQESDYATLLRVLGTYARVLNVTTQRDAVLDEFRAVARANSH